MNDYERPFARPPVACVGSAKARAEGRPGRIVRRRRLCGSRFIRGIVRVAVRMRRPHGAGAPHGVGAIGRMGESGVWGNRAKRAARFAGRARTTKGEEMPWARSS